MGIQWRPEMEVDGGVIDKDHQALIGVINAFCDAPATPAGLPRLRETLKTLERYARIHFAREERMQRSAQYAYADAHHQEHEALTRRLSEMRAELAGVEADASAKGVARLHARIAGLLHHWLVDHIIGSDLRLKPLASTMAGPARDLKPLIRDVAWLEA